MVTSFFVREAFYEYRSILRRTDRELACTLMGPGWHGWVPGLVEPPKIYPFGDCNYPLAV